MSDDLAPNTQSLAELAQSCVKFVEQALKVTLDFEPETLPVLDHYLLDVAAKNAEGAAHTHQLITSLCGAYFGEVVRRHFEGVRWHYQPDALETSRLEFAKFFLSFNPFGMAYEALIQQAAPGWRAHFEVLDKDRAKAAHVLETLGDVREVDYYRLSTRYESLETLVANLIDDKAPPTLFSAEVYARVLDSES